MPDFGTRQQWHGRDVTAPSPWRAARRNPAPESIAPGATIPSDLPETVIAPPPPGLARGTLIATRRGAVPVEQLRAGDRLQTLDEGYATLIRLVLWRAPAQGARAAVHFAAELLGNDRPLDLAPGHRLLLRPEAGPLADQEVLVAASALAPLPGVSRREQPWIDWFAPVLGQHAVIFAENARIESLLPLPPTLATLPPADRAALESQAAARPVIALPVRPIVPEARAHRLILRHGVHLGPPPQAD